jgi:hypothetical protein
MYMNEVADLKKTEIIICMLSRLLRSLATLNTLSVLRTLILFKAFRFPPDPIMAVKIISISDSPTIEPSSQFILSSMYFFGPMQNTLIANSTMKNHVKKALAVSKFELV